MSATTALPSVSPVPEAPPQTPWEYLEKYLDAILDARDYDGRVTFEEFGRLHRLAADLRTDVGYLEGLVGKLDDVIGMALDDVRRLEAEDAS